jgi:Asp-tRNA(Asn)/Glu-tRNA(Gln) amidotransferase A subunit family amidase
MTEPLDDDIEYEEVHSDEVDRVVAALEELGATVNSETIQAMLEDVATSIYYLVYEDEEDESVAAA